MLSAHKEGNGTEARPFSPNTMVSSFGKMVGSIEGLRHKLDNLAVSDVEETQEKIDTLGLRLGELQKTLERLAAIKEQLIKVEAAKAEAGAETPNIAELGTVQKPLKLDMLGQLRNLILFPRVNRGTTDTHDRPLKEFSRVSSEASEIKPLAHASVTTALVLASEAATREVPSSPDSHSTELSWEPLQRSVHEDTSERKREGFFDHELQQAASRTEDLIAAEKPVSEPGASQKSEQPEIESVDAEEFILTEIGETNPVTIQWRESPEPAAFAVPENPTASEFEFDQRLLNDLIKDYGEFVVPSLSSTSAETAPPPKRPESSVAKSQTEFPLVDNATSQKVLPSARKDGELDRKLKKLIKDYGEYDLYSAHTSKKYRTRIIAICAILGVVFGGIYFFSSEENEAITETPAVIQRDSGARNSAEPRKENAGIGPGSNTTSSSRHVQPQQGDQRPSRGSGTGNKPFTNNNNKNDEKVGR
jgi:hypothetical protein